MAKFQDEIEDALTESPLFTKTITSDLVHEYRIMDIAEAEMGRKREMEMNPYRRYKLLPHNNKSSASTINYIVD
ncbi:Hypothetical protein FKW44_002342, partial [Caligus rogercresseyi]